jgi:hypothetical protein
MLLVAVSAFLNNDVDHPVFEAVLEIAGWRGGWGEPGVVEGAGKIEVPQSAHDMLCG